MTNEDATIFAEISILTINLSVFLTSEFYEIISAGTSENLPLDMCTREDSDQTVHSQNLIRIFTGCTLNSQRSLTLKAPRKTASENVVCLCHLLNILADFSNLFLHTGKQYGA